MTDHDPYPLTARQTARVPKSSRPRRPSTVAHRPVEEDPLARLMLDALPEAANLIAGPAVPGSIDIEPLLVAVLAGVLDDQLERMAKVISVRLDSLHTDA